MSKRGMHEDACKEEAGKNEEKRPTKKEEKPTLYVFPADITQQQKKEQAMEESQDHFVTEGIQFF